MATWVALPARSQSPSASSSSVVVPNVRMSFERCPCESTCSRHATTVALCTSSPQQCGYCTCIKFYLLPVIRHCARGQVSQRCELRLRGRWSNARHRQWCRATPRSDCCTGSTHQTEPDRGSTPRTFQRYPLGRNFPSGTVAARRGDHCCDTVLPEPRAAGCNLTVQR